MTQPLASNGLPSPWTEERIELLKKLLATGMSASEMARKLDCGISRNAVIGKLRRLKTPVREKRFTPVRPKSAANKDRSATQRFAQGTRVERMVRQRDIALASPALLNKPKKPAGFLNIAFDELRWKDGRPSNCRFPIGDGPFLFCGRPVFARSSYCTSCRSVVWGRQVATPEQIARGGASTATRKQA